MKNFFVQSFNVSGEGASYEVKGPLIGIERISDIIDIVLRFLYPTASIILFFMLVAGGFQFLFSSGNPEKVKAGKAKITYSILGYALLILSFFMVKLISRIFGLASELF